MNRPFTYDYSDRLVDVELLQTVQRPTQSVQPLQINITFGQRVVTGMQKLVQRYIVLLLTELEDVHFAPEQGTSFWTDMLRGAANNAGQVELAFAFANVDAISQLKLEEASVSTFGAIPDDERVDRVQLLSFTVDQATGVLDLQIEITNKTGDAYVYVVPVTVARG